MKLNTYQFNIPSGNILELYAKNKQDAKKEVKNYNKWLIKTGRGNRSDFALPSTIKKIRY